ncbi:chalcone isomerase family protein [Aliikangiella marina]|uniref:chalcone isomerase family protein n=1 Tax=Aliikangiella marina TaxID=1712262 RepID=UPI00163D75AC|nr:chalcone isomerase family protein [Aliikangiella marina]
MKSKVYLIICSVAAAWISGQVFAKDLKGVKIEEVVNLSIGGEELRLKGTAVRNSSHQSVYIGGLYLQNDAENVEDILDNDGAKRFVIYCQNSSIKPDALIRALNLGITANHSEAELDQLQPMVEQFNQLWRTEIKEGDKVWIDFVPETGTIVSINGKEKGTIPGKAFYDAFLKTWLGDKPINPSMKKQLLGKG